MNPFTNGITPELVLDILRRRWSLGIVIASVALTIVVSVTLSLPNLYRASAVILVEGQQIPQDYVRTTVTMGLERRLRILSEEILSRAKLGELIDQFDLYRDLRTKLISEDTIAAAMRRDIGIQIKGRGSSGGNDTVVFEVGFLNPDPNKVKDIANTLAAFYIEGNVRVRAQQSQDTSEFLGSELQTVKERLERQERQVVEYKTLHMGELPEQMTANLATLTVLQKQMEVISESLANRRVRRDTLQQKEELATVHTGSGAISPPLPIEARLDILKSQLAELRTRFFDTHPDIIRLKQQIVLLEEERKIRKENPQSGQVLSALSLQDSTAHLEQNAVEGEIKNLTAGLEKVQQDIALYKQRIENTPKREQELTSLSRDYQSTRDLYTSMLKRLDEAKLADSLEQRQKAEHFRLLEPAVDPQEPAEPKRALLLLLGCGASVALAVAAMLLWEILDTSIHQLEDLKALTKTPILGSVPPIFTEDDRLQKRRRHVAGAVALAVALLTLASSFHWAAVGNERLVRIFTRPESDLQPK
jgi:polysaccharide chain length determinant protein (PEP-CTERM system associated)